MKTVFYSFLFCTFSFLAAAQPLVTRNGHTSFFSVTPLEDIKAENNQVQAALDPTKKTLAFAMLMKSFLFDKDLMQEHFNENFIESDKYPKATFNGTYTGNVDLTKNGTYPVQVNGSINLHGVTHNLSVPATLTVKDKKLSGQSNFTLKPSDFNIKIPSLVRDKIAQQITVTVKTDFNLPN
jgi:hypothetical protein